MRGEVYGSLSSPSRRLAAGIEPDVAMDTSWPTATEDDAQSPLLGICTHAPRNGKEAQRRHRRRPSAHAAAPTGRVSRPSGRIIHPLEISPSTCDVKARRAVQVTTQRRFSQDRGDIAALCRAAVQSIVLRSQSPGYCGASLDSACTAEGKTKEGINEQRARPVPAGTCENEAAAEKVPAPPFSRTRYAVIASQAGISCLR